MSDHSRVLVALDIIYELYKISDRLDDKSKKFIVDMAARADEYDEDLYVSDAQWNWLTSLEEKYL